jgi:hypothetical protein
MNNKMSLMLLANPSNKKIDLNDIAFDDFYTFLEENKDY